MNDSPAGLVVSHHQNEHLFRSDSEEEDEEDEAARVDWTGGFSDSFTAQATTTTEVPKTESHSSSSSSDGEEAEERKKEESEDENDPFGDFNSSNDNKTTDQKWEEGFSSNFADMDLNKVEEDQKLKKDTPVEA